MRPLLLAAALVAALGGCSAVTGSAAASLLARSTAIGLIKTVNAMGVDPWQASPQALSQWRMACHNLTSLATIWNPAIPGAPLDALNTCAVILEAAAPGAARGPQEALYGWPRMAPATSPVPAMRGGHHG